MKNIVAPQELKRRILRGSELAIVDVREEGVYFDCHLLWASNLPLSSLELRIDTLVPRRSTPVVAYDSNGSLNGPACRACQRLGELGYTDVDVLAGGVEAWRQEGQEVFSGLNVPSKAFGEFLLQSRKPPQIQARDLNARLRRGDDLVVLDSRPADEFFEMSIPEAIDTPGAELVHRVFDIAPDPATDVVVNCAGRTRSIVGAQSLINAGVPNRVMLLKDGTMGWHLAGLELDRGQSRQASWPAKDGYAKSLQAAENVAAAYKVSYIGFDELRQWRADSGRTLYLFDVRTAQEYETEHLAGARHVAGGQLVQTTDEHIAVRNSRIVLYDDRKVRAVMTASWLMQMGHRDVHVLAAPANRCATETGPETARVVGLTRAETLDAGELRAVLQSGESTRVVDLSSSRSFRVAHIRDALWCVRQRLNSALALLPPTGLIVLTSEDSVVAHLAAKDLAQSNPGQLVRVLEGGNRSWSDAGYSMQSGMDGALCEVDDVWDRPYDRECGQSERMQAYLDWEVKLMEQVERDGTAQFYS